MGNVPTRCARPVSNKGAIGSARVILPRDACTALKATFASTARIVFSISAPPSIRFRNDPVRAPVPVELHGLAGPFDRGHCPTSRRQTASQGFLRSVRGRSGWAAACDKYAVARMRLQDLEGRRFITIVFRPVLESGRSKRPRPKSTCSQRRWRICLSIV